MIYYGTASDATGESQDMTVKTSSESVYYYDYDDWCEGTATSTAASTKWTVRWDSTWHVTSGTAATDVMAGVRYYSRDVRWKWPREDCWAAMDGSSYYSYTPRYNPADKLREIIKSRMAPNVISSKSLPRPWDVREERARETLCRVIGQKAFQGYLKRGFVMITGRSGLRYQLFPGHGITQVYNKGEMVERLCVVLRGDFPPTDSLIMRYLLIVNDENKFRGYAIKHQVLTGAGRHPEVRQGPPPPPLTEVYRDLLPTGRRRAQKVLT